MSTPIWLFEIQNVTLPLWVTVLLALLTAVGVFWTQIKSSFENYQNNRTALESKKIETEEQKQDRQRQENKSLKERIQELEQHNNDNENKLLRLNTAIKTMVPLMRVIMEKTPEYSHLIDALEKIADGDV